MTAHRGPQRSYLAGLLGQGIGPSLTPEMHEREAIRRGMRYTYKLIELDDGQLAPERLGALLAHAVDLGFDGLNVTHPVKQVVAGLVDEVAPEAAAIGAVNTVVIDGGRTVGHNTDVTGFALAVAEGLAGADLDRVVLLGAGGAGTAVAHALASHGIGALTVIDTDALRAERLTQSVGRAYRAVTVSVAAPDQLPTLIGEASGLVNATPMGMAAHPGSAVPGHLLRPELWVADIVYRPLRTELVRVATAAGCRVLTGGGMAVNQAAHAFELITGRQATRSAMAADFDQLVAEEIAGPVPDRPSAQRRE